MSPIAGVYTCSNPYAYRHFGNTGLLCAILRGQECRVGPRGTQDPNINTAIGNKKQHENPLTDEIVLRESRQVLPLIQFPTSIVHSSGLLEYGRNALLWKFHVEAQKVLDNFFNRGQPTHVERVVPFQHRNQVQTHASSLGNAGNQLQNPGSHVFAALNAGNGAAAFWSQQTGPGAMNLVTQGFPNTTTTTSQAQMAASQSTASATIGAPVHVPAIPQTPSPNAASLVRNECLTYAAPATLVAASECCRRVRTLSRSVDCAICFTKLHSKGQVFQLFSCSHLFHRDCITTALQHDSKCPQCRVPVSKGTPQGKCPSGTLTISTTKSLCGGFADAVGSIVLRYSFPAGTQLAYHDTPGQAYSASRRVAYLPNNTQGRDLLKRFKYAWSKGLLFGVGTSLTTGRSGQIVWSSVHQKSSLHGGVHGFPDPNYFHNVNAELNALNVPPHDKID